MPEEKVLALLEAAEERAKQKYEDFALTDRANYLLEQWATACALRQLWLDRANNERENVKANF